MGTSGSHHRKLPHGGVPVTKDSSKDSKGPPVSISHINPANIFARLPEETVRNVVIMAKSIALRVPTAV